MYKDTKEALARLEEELLAEEEKAQTPPAQEPEFRDFSEFDQDIFDKTAPTRVFRGENRQPPFPVRAYNSDRTDEDLDEYSEEVWEPRKKDHTLRNLAILAVLLTLCIIMVVAWWVLRLGGGL